MAKNPPQKKTQIPDGFTVKFSHAFKIEIVPMSYVKQSLP